MEVLLLIFIICGYFFPSFIAVARGHRNTMAITLLNLFLGWTILGWIGALIWSVMYQEPRLIEVDNKFTPKVKKEINDFYPVQKKLK